MKKVIVLLCTVLIVAASGMIIGCGSSGGGNDEAQAKAVAKKFLDATNELDIDAMVECVSKADAKTIDVEAAKEAAEQQKQQTGTIDFGLEYKITKVTVDGDTAKAEVDTTYQGQKSSGTIYLVKENGAWKVDVEKTNQSSGGTDESDSTQSTEGTE